MRHEKFTEWLYLSVFDELNDKEKRALDEHVESCDECRLERKKIVSMLDTIAASGAGEPSNALLVSARSSLREALREEPQPQAAVSRPAYNEPLLSRLFGGMFRGEVRHGYRLGLAAAATLSIGFLLGYVTFNTAPPISPVVQERPAPDEAFTGISNVQFLDVNGTEGQVDILYDQVRPVRLTTSVDDPRAQDILGYALLNDENPGVRLKAISVFETDQLAAPPEDMKKAFLEALTSDPNPGVRLQALLVLRRLPFDEDVKETLFYVLSHDENPGIRVAAMNHLAEVTIDGIMPEREMYDIMGARLATD